MAQPLLLTILLLPLLEIAVFVEVGRHIGVGATLLLVIAGAIAGGALIRAQGRAIIGELRAHLGRRATPGARFFEQGRGKSGFDRACLVVAGLLLILPGFLSDAVAAFLVVPPLRRAMRRVVERHVARRGGSRTTVIDVEFRELDPRDGTSFRGAAPPGIAAPDLKRRDDTRR